MLIENNLGIYTLSLVIVSILFLSIGVKLYQDKVARKLNFVFFFLCVLININYIIWFFARANTLEISLIIFDISTFILFSIIPFIGLSWVLYIDYQSNNDCNRTKTLIKLMSFPAIINLILSIVSLFNGCLFLIDEMGNLKRGIYYNICIAVGCFYILATIGILILNSKKNTKKQMMFLSVISIPPIFGALLQTILVDTYIMVPSFTVSILLIYINMQNERLNTDYLTGLHSRRFAENKLEKLFYKRANNSGYACIMIDVDSFKKINDCFGHVVGDEALKCMAKLLEKCIMKPVILSRYGGDEFLILLKAETAYELEIIINNIYKEIVIFNKGSELPFNLTLSAGYDLVDKNRFALKNDLINHIDTHMYSNKRMNRFANMQNKV